MAPVTFEVDRSISSHSIGASNAAWMLLTGDAIPADKALTWGLALWRILQP